MNTVTRQFTLFLFWGIFILLFNKKRQRLETIMGGPTVDWHHLCCFKYIFLNIFDKYNKHNIFKPLVICSCNFTDTAKLCHVMFMLST